MVVTCPRNTSTYNVRITTFMVHFVHFDIDKFIRRLSDRSVFVRLRRLQSIISAITCLVLTVLCVWMVLCSQLDCHVAQQSPYGCSTSSCEIETPLFRCSYSVVLLRVTSQSCGFMTRDEEPSLDVINQGTSTQHMFYHLSCDCVQ